MSAAGGLAEAALGGVFVQFGEVAHTEAGSVSMAVDVTLEKCSILVIVRRSNVSTWAENVHTCIRWLLVFGSNVFVFEHLFSTLVMIVVRTRASWLPTGVTQQCQYIRWRVD